MLSIGRTLAALALSVPMTSAQGQRQGQQQPPAPEKRLSSPQPATNPSYLMRLQRVRVGLDLCVLVRGDGQYHLERLSDKSRILEGNLDADQRRQVIRIVSDDQLFLLRQDQISESMLGPKFDDVRLAILRPRNRWQVLAFTNPTSREPFRRTLDPLLSWLEKLEKSKGQELPEDSGRTNCSLPQDDLILQTRGPHEPAPNRTAQVAPPKETSSLPQLKTRSEQAQPDATPQLTTRPPQRHPDPVGSSAPAAPPPETSGAANKQFMLRMVESWAYPQFEVARCSVISISGAYHTVAQMHEPGSQKVHTSLRDGHFDQAQLASLSKILDGPGLSNLSLHEPQDSSYVPPISHNGFFFWLSFLREGKIYNYELSRTMHSEGGSADNALEKDWKAFTPLLDWLKKNLDMSKSPEVSTVSNGRCLEIP